MSYTYSGDVHQSLIASYRDDEPPFPTDTSLSFPRRNHLREDVDLLKRLLFPRCWNAGNWVEDGETLRDGVANFASLCYSGIKPYNGNDAQVVVDTVVERLPSIRETLKKDVEAAYKGDPAARSYMEIIRSYPGVQAVVVHRIAHAFYEAGAPEYARELAEYAKMESGIDIHPGATIGDYFFIDHGTGVVIGETTTIGEWARIYQDVTLGALHFEEQEDEEHTLKKGYKRHPDIGDSVVIGAGSKVLGAVAIGDHVSIGANSWVTEDVPDHTSVFISEHPTHERKQRD
ncbi:serine acetyltransferase [Haloferax mediterranei ATCC 33500]|uniref:serine O-acetyltransferase n=1 Tax=Haloferax mediterranei (strain ATCC 33500 / DSM 1411 / JCM 8866 / NBRC 14739 / NCIMB 2177 / R-4) TaxID=523841 RepID=I3R6D1_HALMT|nr:serine O-acetyltransferase EpsC [Haloferax mediterranei]AFK19791.1 serine O-acetyltransferase [Haloferax mediterranei ATCC 33500]AHZ23178.1 serine acetyltransferase [Haloferax mediterranei ATCC 33500]ELZ99755.1 serine O-acetyltransferase [Haloferax mediterranei ATCC 33500]MDX5987462.1 serine O-acetyltransferase EpsC [Haloferax mediterranei ATCC 33500]QCQ73963.1 serine acetyltransferase [Haloferax mediterranei ATCC 33500]